MPKFGKSGFADGSAAESGAEESENDILNIVSSNSSSSNGSSGDEAAVPVLKKKKRTKYSYENVPTKKKKKAPKENYEKLWRLTRPKYVLTYHLCRTCRDFLFKDSQKTSSLEGGKIRISLVLCSSCVKKNLDLSDLCYEPKEK